MGTTAAANTTTTSIALCRASVLVVVAILGLVAVAEPAGAREVSGVGATNFETRLESVTPEVPGVRVRIVELGSRIELTNDTDEEIVVLGYQDEPYLRVGPDGVYENLRSPATYINTTRQGGVSIPGTADPEAEPEWQRVSSGNVVRWHDHRIHWMGSGDPPAVQSDPDRTHVVIPEWTVTMRMGEEVIVARGDLRWVPGPSPVSWLLLAMLVFVAVAALGFLGVESRGLAIVLAALIVVDVVHTVGIAWTKAGGVGTKLQEVVSSSPLSLVAWAIAVLALVLLVRAPRSGLAAAAVAGVCLAIFGGAFDVTDWTRSQVPVVWSPWVARLLVAVTLGAGLGLATAAAICLRRAPRLARA